MTDTFKSDESADPAVVEYKALLRQILDRRPSGTRFKLANALGKNRSFISQISNPAYKVPIPARHLARIFEVCRFSPGERNRFLDAYGRAHPGRAAEDGIRPEHRELSISVPDLGDAEKNRQLDTLIRDLAYRMAAMIRSE